MGTVIDKLVKLDWIAGAERTKSEVTANVNIDVRKLADEELAAFTGSES